jgi:hypothetical protein
MLEVSGRRARAGTSLSRYGRPRSEVAALNDDPKQFWGHLLMCV